MKMQEINVLISGGSDTRVRQGELIVPELSRSGLQAKSYNGLPVACAAGVTGEYASAGTLLPCTAGGGSLNAPAKEHEGVHFTLTSHAQQESREEYFPARLRGGGGGKRERPINMTLYVSEDEEDQPTIQAEKAQHQAKRMREAPKEVPASSIIEPTPGPSGLNRSRSPLKTRSQRTTKRLRPCKVVLHRMESDVGASSDECSSPRTVPKTKRHQSTIRLDSDESSEKDTAVSDGDTQPTEELSSYSSSSMEEGITKMVKPKSKRKSRSKKKTGVDSSTTRPQTGTNIEELRAKAAGKPGRPPTTGDYCGLAQQKRELNNEKEREHRLEQEARVFSMEKTIKILRKARLDPDDEMEREQEAPTGDLTNEMRKAQAEVVRIAKVSSNLKGPLQRALKTSASITLAGLEILRTRADQTAEVTGGEELRSMRAQLKKLEAAQAAMDLKFQELREEAEKAQEKAREEIAKRERVSKQLKDSLSQIETLKKRVREERERNLAVVSKITDQTATFEACEPMEVEVIPTPPSPEKKETTPAAKMRITERDLRDFPAMRPPIQGKIIVIPDAVHKRDLPPPEIERDPFSDRVSNKKKKGMKGTN